MEIEVGDYVRTRAGHFYKITKIDKNGLIYWNKIQCGWSMEQLKDIVAKHSKNIIDLIEVGDIVNGMEVLDIHKPRDLWEPIEIRVDSRYTNFILAEDIKTILTKESYMANCYKVGGEDEC